MRILVTGGYGFIGSNFIHKFINHPDVELIINVDNLSTFSNSKNTPRHSKLRNFTFEVGSENIFNLLQNYKITHVLHLADNTTNSYNAIQTNVCNILNLLNNCVKHGALKRFHCISSLSYDELYSASKMSCNNIIQAFFNEFKLPITINVCGQVYGPRQHQSKLIPSFISNLISNIDINANPYTHNWVHVDDVCNTVFDTITNEGCISGMREIKSSFELTEYEIACKLKELINSTANVFCNATPPRYHPFSNCHSQVITTTDIEMSLHQIVEHYSLTS